ncbi:hypothetical protein K3495_g6142 [Podosphaera aphanis]|nr:hypothetical protein K3495_g6142 [Podosphaera aphanis]
MNDAARAALPVYCTTPVSALLREVGWGPALAWLERLHDRLAVRVASANPQHPLLPEILGATEGLTAALHNPMARFATNVTVCLDNQEAVLRLKSNAPTPSSSKRIKLFQELSNSWTTRNRCSFTQPGTVDRRWCPAHVGILGNETADSLAKLACEFPAPPLAPSIARAKREIKARYEASVATYWSRNASDRYRKLRIKANAKISPELASIDRRTICLLLVARSGHGDFAEYHRRF